MRSRSRQHAACIPRGVRRVATAGSVIGGWSLVLLVLAGCAREAREEQRPEPVTARVVRRDLVESCTEEGRLEAYRVYAFYPNVGTHPLRTLHVAEGDTVQAGDPLFAFDTEQIDTERDLLRATRDAAEAKLRLLQERRRGAEAVEARQHLLRMQQDRDDTAQSLEIKREMAAQGLASAAEAEQLAARLRAGELGVELAALRAAELDARERSPEMAELEIRILQHRHALQQLDERADEFRASAPFDGRILRINDSIKHLSALSDRVDLPFRLGHGPLILLGDTDTLRVLTRFFARDIARIRVGQRAQVSAQHVPGRVFEGEVVAVGELGETVGQTTTVEVEVLVPNPGNRLKPGLKAETRIVVDEGKDRLALPVEFIRHGPDETFVWRASEGGVLEKVTIRTGMSDGRYTEVTHGLQENDILVME